MCRFESLAGPHQHGHDGGHVLEVALLQQALEEVAQLADAHAAPLVGVQAPVAPPLQLRRVALLPLPGPCQTLLATSSKRNLNPRVLS